MKENGKSRSRVRKMKKKKVSQELFQLLLLSFQSNKPIMEKKRRARINHCLNELKTLILEAMKKDVSFYFIIAKDLKLKHEPKRLSEFNPKKIAAFFSLISIRIAGPPYKTRKS